MDLYPHVSYCPPPTHTPLPPTTPPTPSPRSCDPHEQEEFAFITIDPEPEQILSEHCLDLAGPFWAWRFSTGTPADPSGSPSAVHSTPLQQHGTSLVPSSQHSVGASHELSCCCSAFHLFSLPPFTSHDLRMVRISSLHWDIKGALGHQFLCRLCSPSSSRGWGHCLLAPAKPRFPFV